MKLYYKPGACSLATHIILNELDLPFELDKVDTQHNETENGQDYLEINPKGYVPALVLDSGDVLTENSAVLQHIADLYPDAKLAPQVGTLSRTRFEEYLSYTSSELHKSFSPLFSSSSNDEEKAKAKINVASKFNYLNKLLSDGRKFLIDDTFTVADAYLFTISNWANFVDIDLAQWPYLSEFVAYIAERPAAKSAMKVEGLI